MGKKNCLQVLKIGHQGNGIRDAFIEVVSSKISADRRMGTRISCKS